MPNRSSDFFRYIPVRERDVRWGLYVTGVGCTSVRAGEPYPPQKNTEIYYFTWEKGRALPEYQVSYITDGEGLFESVPTGNRHIKPGTVFLLFPGVWHRYRPRPETGWVEWWVTFNGEVMDRLVAKRFFMPDRAVLSTGLQETILAPYQSLLNRVQGELTGFPHLLAVGALEILAAVSAVATCEPAELIPQGPQDVLTVKDRMVAEAMRLIWQQSNRPMTVQSLLRQLPITQRSLERRFLAAVGHRLCDEIRCCRLDRARRLLMATDMSMKEVAFAAGFRSADRMGRVFRAAEGITPSEYRRRNSQ